MKLGLVPNTKSLEKRFNEWGLSIVSTPKDGDCCLHALIHVAGLKITTDELRKLLIQTLREKENMYIGNSQGTRTRLNEYPTPAYGRILSWKDYLEMMSKPKEWCDEKMILAACIYLKREIILAELFSQLGPIR